tara:strand:+ start:233 stop:523 length:291 start_codon:yes stop_codon:yes gene_type:complete
MQLEQIATYAPQVQEPSVIYDGSSYEGSGGLYELLTGKIGSTLKVGKTIVDSRRLDDIYPSLRLIEKYHGDPVTYEAMVGIKGKEGSVVRTKREKL